MSRFFNNKWTIIALVAFSIYFVISNAILPFVGSALDDSETIDMPGMIDATPTISGSNASNSVEIAKVFWNDVPARDPFSPKTSIIKQEINDYRKIRLPDSNTKGSQQIKKLTLPKLTGFVSGSNAKLVVLDGQVLAVGENIKGFKIISINTDTIKLQQHRNKKIVTLSLE